MTQTVLERIQSRANNDDLWSLMLDYFHAHGVTKVSYHHFSADLQDKQGVTVNADGFSQAWVCHYIEQKLYLVDPITELAQCATRPFLWSDIGTLMRLSPAQKGYLAQMRAAGLGEGLAFQVFGPGLRNGYVGLGFDAEHDMPSAALQIDFQLIAQAGHLKYCELNPIGPGQGDLSPRERQILRWIARGKSNSTIAAILAVSPHTIDTMVRRIFAKLGVADRTTAAIQGVGSGLIVP